MLEGDADQNTPSANLRYLLRGLAGLLANLFSVYVWKRESHQTFFTNVMPPPAPPAPPRPPPHAPLTLLFPVVWSRRGEEEFSLQ